MTRTDQGRRTADTFAALHNNFRFSDQVLGDRAGYTIDEVRARRKGETPLNVDDLERFGAVFGVPAEVLLLDRRDALRWVLDHEVVIEGPTNSYGNRHRAKSMPSGQGDRASIWYRRRPARHRRLTAVS